MKPLENKVAIITGAAAGMGKSIAKLFAAEGASMLICDIDEQRVRDLQHTIESEGGEALAVRCDMSDPEDVANMIKLCIDTFGRIDVLVNNAGIMDDFFPVDRIPPERWQKIMDVNLNGPYHTMRLVVPDMLSRKSGSIINIGSIGSHQGARAGAAYTASKHALAGLTKNTAFMYAKEGIRCNLIAPGGVNTEIGLKMHPDPIGYERIMTGAANMPRMGEADEIAQIALFLASDAASLVNGAIVTADGGWTAF
jgi:NAD(P)-dependent dehydrogenase (short-subunit alcohol dehydrogenase family)